MARKSYQKGSLQFHRGCWTVRYRYFNSETNVLEMRRSKLEGYIDPRDKKGARRAADQFMIKVNQHNSNPRKKPEKLTFAQFIANGWASYLEVARMSDSTLYGYKTLLSLYLIPKLGNKTLRELTPSDMTQFFDEIKRDYPKLSDKYLLNIYSLLRRMLEVARQYELIDSSPLRPILHKPSPQQKEKPTLTLEEARKLISVIDPQYRLFMITLWTTGMRVGEVCALRWLNINIERRELSITNAVWRRRLKAPKTEASKRVIVLPRLLVDEFVSHRRASRFSSDGDFVFPASDGRALDTDYLRKYVLYPAMEKAGIERGSRTHGFHAIRHTVGSLVHKRTGDVKLVQEFLGHARIETTADIYVHVDDETVGKAADILFAELNESATVN